MAKKDRTLPTELKQEDIDLFHEMVGDVKPVTQNQASLNTSKPKPQARQQEADDQQVLQDLLSDHHEHLETGEELSYQQPGVQKNIMRKLRRGQYRIDAETDLHGHTTEEARKALASFLNESKQQSYRCVRIIHGKGTFRQGGPILKPLVNSWLRQRSEILAFCSARPHDGGTGAVYALIKSNKPQQKR